MIFEDDETLRMYVEESLEHLSDIENDLLAIESQGADIDEDLVNNVFRAAHSIKGGAGFMGLGTIKDLSHNLESILGLVRSHEMVPTPEIISVLLQAFDRLRELIQDVETSNSVNIDTLLQALIAITEGSLPEAEKKTVSEKVFIQHPVGQARMEASRFDLDQAFKHGKFLYLLEFDMLQDIQKKNKTPLDVITSLLNSGIILDSKIDFDAVGTLEDDFPRRIPFLILFASIIEPDMASILVDLDPEYVHHIPPEATTESGGTESPVAADRPAAPTAPPEKPAVKTVEKPAPAMPAPAPPLPEPKPEPAVSPPAAAALPPQEPAYASTAASWSSGNTDDPDDEISDSASKNDKQKSQASLRVNVNLLDTLMTLAGELVLSRNQLTQGIATSSSQAIEAAGQRIDMITSELQEAIMRTRMQPIANVFNKFTRIVRDLSKSLHKEINLKIEGKEVELDKTIIEAINDPLTHLVRNSVDHGIETPDIRQRSGKPRVGTIRLKAFHEAGQVNIEIEDDGKGLDPEAISKSAFSKGLISEQDIQTLSAKEKINLIFLPGFSTAQQVTDVSGRGVGMDVVKTNLDRLGGIVDIDSKVGSGTIIRIKLPLTLAIIPSQIISVGKERYAIPQVNLNELLRIPAAQVKERIEKVGKAAVVRLRGTLLPLLDLSDVLGIKKTYIDPETGEEKEDRRVNIADRRSAQLDGGREKVLKKEDKAPRKQEDRRFRADSAINIAVVSTGTFRYGLVVDQLRDSEEIVVKPLGRHLKDCKGYAGATIMGDGRVALILDVASLAEMADLSSSGASKTLAHAEKELIESTQRQEDKASLLLFRNAETEQFGVPLNLVERIERIKSTDIEYVGGKRVVQYRGGSLPLHELGEVANIQPLPEREQVEVIVFKFTGREIGLMVSPPVDAVEATLNVDASTLKQPGIMGSMIIGGRTTLMVDIFGVVKTLNPEWFTGLSATAPVLDSNGQMQGGVKILFAEDSAFFRNQVTSFLTEDGYEVLVAEDGVEAFSLLETHVDEIGLVLTDLEMPNMDGFELTRKIKGDSRFSHLTVIALTSLAGEEDIIKGQAAGIDDYQIKLDREKLLISIRDTMASIV
ncbi:two-component system chemotaxis sensor kinase CheA [Desulfobotulus alkaliphilus]|uniref:histidine kinase n=1 Tax=Desulfobotulus alkaliphilus TaxID=622671 RepID=A0A562RRA3_9BACT|nr:chemotaxis protein CheW [Desulfobotulus alkaliphilus]TWI71607.1 two-component system chemotaxis sensor kinase CheA [Desulfobotulus alkaliphilus]